jgi:hypothetical protein
MICLEDGKTFKTLMRHLGETHAPDAAGANEPLGPIHGRVLLSEGTHGPMLFS